MRPISAESMNEIRILRKECRQIRGFNALLLTSYQPEGNPKFLCSLCDDLTKGAIGLLHTLLCGCIDKFPT